MQNIQTWSPPAERDDTNPNQAQLQYWSPINMGYRSAYWNEQPTTVQNLMGVLPDSRFVQVGIIAGLSVAAYATFKALTSRGLMGLSGSRRSRRRGR